MIDPAKLRQWSIAPDAFRADLVIDSTPPRRFGDVIEPWQRADFEALDPAWRRLSGQSLPATTSRAYLERSRGHAKTSDIAAMIAWVLVFSTRRLTGVAAAADQDQARLIRDAIDKLIGLNPWLSGRLEVQRYTVINRQKKSALEILSADVASSWGQTPDFVIIDELTHWTKPDLWHSLFSASAKRPDCVLVCISNAGAGKGTSWQWEVREAARTSDGWYFHSLDGPQASWITPAMLDEQRRILPKIVFERVWGNRWTSGADLALESGWIDGALSHGLQELKVPEDGWSFGAGLDLGLTKDHAALVIVGRHYRVVHSDPYWQYDRAGHLLPERLWPPHVATKRLRVAKIYSWAPPRGGQIDLGEVERAVIAARKLFRFSIGYCDPWAGQYLVQRLNERGVPFELFPFTEPNLDVIARNLVNQFSERNVQMYPHAGLAKQLRQTQIYEKVNGKLKLDWPRDRSGHGDVACSFSLALLAAEKSKPAPRWTNVTARIPGHNPWF